MIHTYTYIYILFWIMWQLSGRWNNHLKCNDHGHQGRKRREYVASTLAHFFPLPQLYILVCMCVCLFVCRASHINTYRTRVNEARRKKGKKEIKVRCTIINAATNNIYESTDAGKSGEWKGNTMVGSGWEAKRIAFIALILNVVVRHSGRIRQRKRKWFRKLR